MTTTLTHPVAPTGAADVAPILLSPPQITPDDRSAVIAALDSGWIAPVGPNIDAFEAALAAYVGQPSALALSSGSAGLLLALRIVGVEPADEVLVQTSTFAATAFAVSHLGASPTFVDSAHDTWNIDPNLVAEVLAQRARRGRLPRAVVAVDLYGLCPDYPSLKTVCERYDVALIEDAAEALGTQTSDGPAGTFGRMSILSFNGNKIITTSGGGALLGSTADMERARHLATQARASVSHYEHHEIGYNFRLSNVLAALGHSQLDRIEAIVDKRRGIEARYRAELPSLGWPPAGICTRPNAWLSVAMLPASVEPARVVEALAAESIEARQAWMPMHMQPVYDSADAVGGCVAERLFERGICLPSGTELTEDQQSRVIAAISLILRERRN